MILLLLTLFLQGNSSQAKPSLKEVNKTLEKFSKISKAECKTIARKPALFTVPLSDQIIKLTDAEAQCTQGAIDSKQGGEIRILTYPKDVKLDVEPIVNFVPGFDPAAFNKDKATQITEHGVLDGIEKKYPGFSYASNACMFEGNGDPTGYVKTNGVMRSKVTFKLSKDKEVNFAKENSIFMRYRPAKRIWNADHTHFDLEYTGDSKWRLISLDDFGTQLEMSEYTALHPDVKSTDDEDFFSANQIDFAIQSGPALIRQTKSKPEGDAELLSKEYSKDPIPTVFNMPDSGHKTFMGTNQKGELVIVDSVGDLGPYCIAKYMKDKFNINNLLTRDSARIGGSAIRNETGKPEIYNNSGSTAHLLIVH